MVYGLLRALPGDHRFVDPVIRATRWRLANLTPASGRQNHTASPSATASARLTPRCVHRIGQAAQAGAENNQRARVKAMGQMAVQHGGGFLDLRA